MKEDSARTLERLVAEHIVTRAMPVVPASYDEKTRTVRAILATESPVQVMDYDRWEVIDEILLMSGIQLPSSRQVPLLDSHSRWSIDDVIGSCRELTVVGPNTETVLNFSSLETDAETKVREGHVTDISAGYRVIESVMLAKGTTQTINGRQFTAGTRNLRVATKWAPREGSLTPIGADEAAKVRSSFSPEEFERRVVEEVSKRTKSPIPQGGTKMGESTIDLDVKVKEARDEARNAEKLRVRGINKIVELATGKMKEDELEGLRTKAIEGDTTEEAFRQDIFERTMKAEPIKVIDPTIGMSAKEVKRWSLLTAIRQIGINGKLEGLEKEASEAVSKVARREANGFYIPHDVAMAGRGPIPDELRSMLEKYGIEPARLSRRALNVTTGSAGGFTVGTEVLGGSMIELLRNLPLVAQMGARTLSGLVGNIAIPRQAGGATAYWLPESGTITNGQQTFSQLGLTPHRLGAATAYQKELLMQSSIDIEGFVREDLMRVLAIEKDRVAINGSGNAGEPLGILNTTGVNSVTFGAAPTWAKAVLFETEVATDNALMGSLAYLTTPAVKGAWKTTQKVSGQAIFLWEGGEVNGYPAFATNQVPSDKVIFANWSDLILADWAGIDVVVDPFSLKKAAQIEIAINLWCDLGLRHEVSFCPSTDSGKQ